MKSVLLKYHVIGYVFLFMLSSSKEMQSQAPLHSSYEYNMSVFLQDSVHRAEYKALKRALHKIRHFHSQDKESYSFRVQFHDLTGSTSEAFREDVTSQVASLNRDFNMESISISESHEYSDLIDTAKISFALVDTDRTLESVSWKAWNSFKFSANKGINPDTSVIHIWVIELPDTINSYASNPNGNKNIEGIVLDPSVFGSTAHEDFNEGKTLTFLMGIYLGLEPLYGTHPCADDGILETPRHHKIATCDEPAKTTCSNQTMMYDNYMAQTFDECKKYFTKGQVARMKYFIRNAKNLKSKIAK